MCRWTTWARQLPTFRRGQQPAHSGKVTVWPPRSVMNSDCFPFKNCHGRAESSELVLGMRVHLLLRSWFFLKQLPFYQHLPPDSWLLSGEQQNLGFVTFPGLFRLPEAASIPGLKSSSTFKGSNMAPPISLTPALLFKDTLDDTEPTK